MPQVLARAQRSGTKTKGTHDAMPAFFVPCTINSGGQRWGRSLELCVAGSVCSRREVGKNSRRRKNEGPAHAPYRPNTLRSDPRAPAARSERAATNGRARATPIRERRAQDGSKEERAALVGWGLRRAASQVADAQGPSLAAGDEPPRPAAEGGGQRRQRRRRRLLCPAPPGQVRRCRWGARAAPQGPAAEWSRARVAVQSRSRSPIVCRTRVRVYIGT
eukprot:SAG11_NODE_1684_length_4449_cov_7.642299_2_plen_219_part_00